MAKDYFVLIVDMGGSSRLQTSEESREKVSRILENCFRFFMANAGLTNEDCAWAGDGGFAAFATDGPKFTANDALRAAQGFAKHVPAYVNREYLRLDVAFEPTYRITIGRVLAEPSYRISNLAGRMLNLLLKRERDFGREGHISVWQEVYDDLGDVEKTGFTKRNTKVHDKTVYDLPILPEKSFMNFVLSAKEEIDRRTLYFFSKQVPKTPVEARDESAVFRKVISVVFTPTDLYKEIVEKIHFVLTKHWQGTNFRVAYARPYNPSELHLQFSAAACTARDLGKHIPKEGQYTASIAWRTGKPVFVESTAAELKKPKKSRRFSRLYRAQSLESIASIACFPVCYQPGRARPTNIHGVLCVDSSTDGFFSARKIEVFVAAMNVFISELLIAEMFDALLERTGGNEQSRKQRKRK